MANTNSKAKPITFAICYGFMGGGFHSRGLRKALESSGLRPAASLEQADIVIAHSAACWLLPGALSARLLMLVGAALPQTQPRKTYAEANRNIWRLARQQGRLGQRMVWSLASWFYGVKNPAHNYKIAKLAQQPSASLPTFKSQKVVFVANQFDPWPHSPALTANMSRPWIFISLPGSHENLWEEPEKYAEIIRAELLG